MEARNLLGSLRITLEGSRYLGGTIGSGGSFCAVRANAENSCSGAFVRTFARTLPKCSLVGILCCVRDFTFCERRMFLFESVRDTVRKNAPEPNKNISAVDILCFFREQSEIAQTKHVTSCIVRMLLFLTFFSTSTSSTMVALDLLLFLLIVT